MWVRKSRSVGKGGLRSDQSRSVGATTIVGTTSASIETSAGVTPSATSAICSSSSLSVGAVNEIEVGCTGARGCSSCLLLRSLSENCKEDLSAAGPPLGSDNEDLAPAY